MNRISGALPGSMRAVLVFAMALSIPLFAHGQQDTTVAGRPLKYYSHLSAGVMITSRDNLHGIASVSLSTVHGVVIKEKTRFGIGIGLDEYTGNTAIPVFASLSRDVFGRKHKLFCELNAGRSLVRPLKPDVVLGNEETLGKIMFNPLIGYRIVTENINVAFSVGYKFQRIESRYSYPNFFAMTDFMPSYSSETIVQTDLNRLTFSIRVGFR